MPTVFPTVAVLAAQSPPSPSSPDERDHEQQSVDEPIEPQQSSTTRQRGCGGPQRRISLTEQGQMTNGMPSMAETAHCSSSSTENTAHFESSGRDQHKTNSSSIKFQHTDLYGSFDDLSNYDSNQGLTVSTAPTSFAEKPARRNSDGVSVSTNGSMYSEKWNTSSANTSVVNGESAAINVNDGIVQEEPHQSETALDDDLHQKSEAQALMNDESNESLDHVLASKCETSESSAVTAISSAVRRFIGSATDRAQNARSNQDEGSPNVVKEIDEAEKSQCSQSSDSGSDVIRRAEEPLEEVQKECKTSLIEGAISATSPSSNSSNSPKLPATHDNTPTEQAKNDLTMASEALCGPDGAAKDGDGDNSAQKSFISTSHARVEPAADEAKSKLTDSSSSDSVSISRTRPSLVSDFKETVKRNSFQRRMTSPKDQAVEAVVDWPSPVSSIGSPVLKEREQRTSENTIDSQSLPPLPLRDQEDDPSSASKSWPITKSRQTTNNKNSSDESLDPSCLGEKTGEDSNDQSKLSSNIVWPSNGPSNVNFRDGLRKTASSSRILKGIRSSAQREADLHSSLRSFNSGHRKAQIQNLRACLSEDCAFETSGQPSSTSDPLISPVASESEKNPDKQPQDNAVSGDVATSLNQEKNNPWLVSTEQFEDEEVNEEYYTPSPLHEVPSASNDGESVVSSLDSLASPVHPSNNNISRMHRQHQRRDSDSSCSTLSLASPTQAATQNGKNRPIGSRKSSMKSMDISDRAIVSKSFRSPSEKSKRQFKTSTQESRPGSTDLLEESERSGLSKVNDFNESEHTKSDASQNNYPPKVKCLADGLPRRAMERRSSDRSLTNSSCYSRATMQSLQSEISNLQPSGLADDVALHLEHSMMSMNTYQSSDGIDDIDPTCTTGDTKIDFDFAMNSYIKAMNHGQFNFGASAIGEDSAWEGDDGMLAARAYMGLGYTRQYKGELESSMQAYSKAINLIEDDLGVDHPSAAPVHYAMGVVMIGMAMQLDASEHFTKALKLYKAMLSGDTDTTVRADIFSTEGMLFDVLGERNRAIDCFRQTVVLCQSLGQPSLKFAGVMFELGSLLSQRGEYGESAYCFNFALQIRKNLLGDSFLVARTHYSLGVTQATLELGGNLPSGMAAGHLQEALRICSIQFEEEHLQFAIILHALGVLNERNGDFLAASVWFAKERDIRKQVLGGGELY